MTRLSYRRVKCSFWYHQICIRAVSRARPDPLTRWMTYNYTMLVLMQVSHSLLCVLTLISPSLFSLFQAQTVNLNEWSRDYQQTRLNLALLYTRHRQHRLCYELLERTFYSVYRKIKWLMLYSRRYDLYWIVIQLITRLPFELAEDY